MKRIVLFVTVCAACFPLSVRAEDRAAEAAAKAQREEAEERYKLLHGKLEAITETQELLLRNYDKLQQRISAQASEIDDLKRTLTQARTSAVTLDQLREIVEKVQEIDRKRLADNERVLAALKDLQKMPLITMPPAPEKPSPAASQEGLGPTWDYTVRANDTLQKIVNGYNEELAGQGLTKITVAQVLKANPGLQPNKLYVGKKILIPIPPKKDNDKKDKTKTGH